MKPSIPLNTLNNIQDNKNSAFSNLRPTSNLFGGSSSVAPCQLYRNIPKTNFEFVNPIMSLNRAKSGEHSPKKNCVNNNQAENGIKYFQQMANIYDSTLKKLQNNLNEIESNMQQNHAYALQQQRQKSETDQFQMIGLDVGRNKKNTPYMFNNNQFQIRKVLKNKKRQQERAIVKTYRGAQMTSTVQSSVDKATTQKAMHSRNNSRFQSQQQQPSLDFSRNTKVLASELLPTQPTVQNQVEKLPTATIVIPVTNKTVLDELNESTLSAKRETQNLSIITTDIDHNLIEKGQMQRMYLKSSHVGQRTTNKESLVTRKRYSKPNNENAAQQQHNPINILENLGITGKQTTKRVQVMSQKDGSSNRYITMSPTDNLSPNLDMHGMRTPITITTLNTTAFQNVNEHIKSQTNHGSVISAKGEQRNKKPKAMTSGNVVNKFLDVYSQGKLRQRDIRTDAHPSTMEFMNVEDLDSIDISSRGNNETLRSQQLSPKGFYTRVGRSQRHAVNQLMDSKFSSQGYQLDSVFQNSYIKEDQIMNIKELVNQSRNNSKMNHFSTYKKYSVHMSPIVPALSPTARTRQDLNERMMQRLQSPTSEGKQSRKVSPEIQEMDELKVKQIQIKDKFDALCNKFNRGQQKEKQQLVQQMVDGGNSKPSLISSIAYSPRQSVTTTFTKLNQPAKTQRDKVGMDLNNEEWLAIKKGLKTIKEQKRMLEEKIYTLNEIRIHLQANKTETPKEQIRSLQTSIVINNLKQELDQKYKEFEKANTDKRTIDDIFGQLDHGSSEYLYGNDVTNSQYNSEEYMPVNKKMTGKFKVADLTDSTPLKELMDSDLNVKQTHYQVIPKDEDRNGVETQLEQMSLRDPSVTVDRNAFPQVEILKNTEFLNINQQQMFKSQDEDAQLDELILQYYTKEYQIQNGLYYQQQDQKTIDKSIHINALKTQKLKNIKKTQLKAFDKKEYLMIKHQQNLKHQIELFQKIVRNESPEVQVRETKIGKIQIKNSRGMKLKMSSNNVTSNNNYSREQRQSKQSQYKDFENSKHVTSQVYEVVDSDVINEAANQESIPSSTQVTKIHGLNIERLQLTNALSSLPMTLSPVTDYAKAENIESDLLAIEKLGTQYRPSKKQREESFNNAQDLSLSIMNTSNDNSDTGGKTYAQIQATPVTNVQNSSLRGQARKQFENNMKIDTWEVKDGELSDDLSASHDHRPTDREANMVSKITEVDNECTRISEQNVGTYTINACNHRYVDDGYIPQSGLPKETSAFDASPMFPKKKISGQGKVRAPPTRQRSTVLRRLIKDSNSPSPTHLAESKSPGSGTDNNFIILPATQVQPTPQQGTREVQNGKILLIQNIDPEIEDLSNHAPIDMGLTTGALNSPGTADSQVDRSTVQNVDMNSNIQTLHFTNYIESPPAGASVEDIMKDLQAEEEDILKELMNDKHKIKLMEESINAQLRQFVSKKRQDRKMTPDRIRELTLNSPIASDDAESAGELKTPRQFFTTRFRFGEGNKSIEIKSKIKNQSVITKNYKQRILNANSYSNRVKSRFMLLGQNQKKEQQSIEKQLYFKNSFPDNKVIDVRDYLQDKQIYIAGYPQSPAHMDSIVSEGDVTALSIYAKNRGFQNDLNIKTLYISNQNQSELTQKSLLEQSQEFMMPKILQGNVVTRKIDSNELSKDTARFKIKYSKLSNIMESELGGNAVTLGLQSNIIVENGMLDTMRLQEKEYQNSPLNQREYRSRELLIRQSSPSKQCDTDNGQEMTVY